ncbi:hypothetical protein [Hymenobacter latericus]|uniref:hypothetical protein n=1 Tax=Hymenobacter sp. YIM 151858-1 TaxID=2987688 RepID=UPI00222632E0|nr:hypothetical protein [Hymenobacter sp. YIM 151858-1]UYZ59204.1 hypothetical protein OIS50_00020 [Hymenobacter sp. YIM 151858-1]
MYTIKQPNSFLKAPISFRSAVICLGWFGLALFLTDRLFDYVPLETTHYGLLKLFNKVKNLLFFIVWPGAMLMQAKAVLGKRKWPVLRVVTVVVSMPWLLLALALLAFDDEDRWVDQQVLYRNNANPGVRIAAQYLEDWPSISQEERIVKLTPVLGLWQHVETVDTATFDKTGWQRVPQ